MPNRPKLDWEELGDQDPYYDRVVILPPLRNLQMVMTRPKKETAGISKMGSGDETTTSPPDEAK